MDTTTGQLYDSREAARRAGVRDEDIAEILATAEQADQISRHVERGIAEDLRRANRRAEQKARRANYPR